MNKPLKDQAPNPFVSRLQHVAGDLPYPPTPNIAAQVNRRLSAQPDRPMINASRLVWVGLLAVVLIVGLMAVPGVRAAVVEFLQLGVVRIYLAEPTPTLESKSTPLRSATPLSSLLDLAGETTLAEAQSRVDFPVRFPPSLGSPDNVYLQDLNGPVVVMVWLVQPEQVGFSLHLLGPGAAIQKIQPAVIEETYVGDRSAVWAEGPYLLQTRNGNYDIRRLVEGKVLIWNEGDITYRLESNLSLAKAVQLAESIQR